MHRVAILLLSVITLSACKSGDGADAGQDASSGMDRAIDAEVFEDAEPSDLGVRDAEPAAPDTGGVGADAGLIPDASRSEDASAPDASEPAVPHDGGVLAACSGPCCPEPLPFAVASCTNLARTATASASRTYNVEVARRAVDGERLCTAWNAGGYPPQWWQVDLGTPQVVRGVTLIPESAPATISGTHRVVVSDDGLTFAPVLTIQQSLTRGDVYVFEFPALVTARYLRLETTVSTSWVAWREVGVFRCP